MRIVNQSEPTVVRHPVAKGYLVHGVTAFGAVCSMFGLIAVAEGEPQEAIVWLAIAMVLDGVDGLGARAWRVREHVPRIDGGSLDLVVDFVNCVVIPVLFLHRFNMLPAGGSLYIGAFVLFLGALWMSRTDQMTDDKFFNGFPCEWNMVVPTLYLLGTPKWFNAATCAALALTQLTNWKFIHPMQVRHRRSLNIAAVTTWLATVLVMTSKLPEQYEAGKYLLVACPLYIVSVGARRTLTGR